MTIKVTFKEEGFPFPCERKCYAHGKVTTFEELKAQAIKFYGLDESDIDWYKIEEVSE